MAACESRDGPTKYLGCEMKGVSEDLKQLGETDIAIAQKIR